MFAVAAADDPPPPVKETVGADEYPFPPSVTVTAVTTPEALTVAVAVAPFPPPPEIETLGADV